MINVSSDSIARIVVDAIIPHVDRQVPILIDRHFPVIEKKIDALSNRIVRDAIKQADKEVKKYRNYIIAGSLLTYSCLFVTTVCTVYLVKKSKESDVSSEY